MYHRKREPADSWANASLCFFAGALVGAAVTLLYTPQTGEETRAQLMDKTTQLKDKITDATTQVADKVTDLSDQATRKVKEWKDGARNSVHEVGNELQEA